MQFSSTPVMLGFARRRSFAAAVAASALVAIIAIAYVLAAEPALKLSESAARLEIALSVVVLVCVVALIALEFELRWLAFWLLAPVVAAIAATIGAWVFGQAPPFALAIFSAPPAVSWFPTPDAVAAVIPLALVSLAIMALTFDRLLFTVASFAWGTGILLSVAPPLRVAVMMTMELLGKTPQRGPLYLFESAMLMLLGLALLSGRNVRAFLEDANRSDNGGLRGARWRALFVVIAIAGTVGLWYAVRSTEVRQLRSDVEFALEEVARSLQIGIADNVASADRLWQHWQTLRWKVTDEVFIEDARTYMRLRPSVAAVAMLDERGAVLNWAQRTRPASTDDSQAIELGNSAAPPAPLADRTSRLALLEAALTSKSRVRGQVWRTQNAEFAQALVPVFDTTGNFLGAFWLLHRPEISIERILKDSAPDFHVRASSGDRLMFDRPPRDGLDVNENFFRRVAVRRVNSQDFTLDVAPGPKVVARALSWAPLLVLAFAWASLALLMLALYNERRARALLGERERILNQSLDLICTLSEGGIIVTANDAADRVLGIPAPVLIGRSLLEFVPAGHREGMLANWLTHASETQSAPTPFLRVDGRGIFLQAVVRWSPEERLWYCAMRDITAEHELALERRQAEETFRIGVDQAGCAVYELQPDANGIRRIRWVGATRALTGLDATELSQLGFDGWMRLVHPEDAQHVRSILERCIESEQPHTVDYRLRRKDGGYVPVLDRGLHLPDVRLGTSRMIGALIDLSAIRQQETALRRSEERYRIIASQVGAVIIERDTATGRIRAFGPVEQIFGYTKEQLESRPMTRDDTMIHPDDRGHYFAAVANAELNLSTYYVEHRRRHRGGHYIHIASRGVVLPGTDGRAEREIIAVTDITDRKRAELALQQSEERFRLAVEQSRQIVYEYGLDAQLRIASRRFAGAIEGMLGYTPGELDELYAVDNFALVHPDDLPMVSNLGRLAITGGAFQVEHRMRHKSGHYVHVESRGALRKDDRGQAIGILGLLLDISASKSAESDRQRYTAQLRALADIAHHVGAFLSLHELLKYLATSMRELVGANAASALVSDAILSTTDVVAVSYAEHYGTQRGTPTALGSSALHAHVRATNTARRYTTQMLANDSELATLTQHDDLRHPLRGWLGAPLIARDGTNLGLLELSDKIDGEFSESDLQILNQLAGLASVAIENIRSYATLEERVAARTRELEISNRELEAFSYSVSHDLRAPLRAIAGFSSILETEYGGKLDAGARRYLQRIAAGVERMANLIDDLLSLARVSRADLKREPVDLTGLSKSILKRQIERLASRNVKIDVDPKMHAIADPRLVEVALENLIENALKFSGTREKSHVHVGQRRVDGRTVFYVADNGVGFDTKYASNLFGVFQRLHSAADFPGTGVGLATVQRIVQRHQGRIWAEAEIDGGATFYFTLASES